MRAIHRNDFVRLYNDVISYVYEQTVVSISKIERYFGIKHSYALEILKYWDEQEAIIFDSSTLEILKL